MVLSPDALVLRLITADPLAVAAARALFSGVAIAALVLALPEFRHNFRWKPVLIYGVCYAVGLAFFPLSIYNTHVANTLVIISTAPIIAAVGAFFILGERPRRATMLAALLVFVSVAAIFANELGEGAIGDVYAFFVALSLAASGIVIRRYHKTALYSGLIVGGVITFALFAPVADWSGIDARDWWLIALDGVVIMSLSFLLLVTAARVITPVEFNLLFLLETVFGPLWVWLILNEAPPAATVASGVVIAAVLIVHAIWLTVKPAMPPHPPHL